MTTRAHWKQLVLTRQDDAAALYDARRYAGAYYISGLAVECGIKVIIAGQFKRNQIPDKKLVERTYSHDFDQLIGVAGLHAQLQTELNRNPSFFVYWNVVKDWNISCRYNSTVRKLDARDMLSAITNPTDGVISWLRRRW